MKKIFITYSRRSESLVKSLVEDLKALGYSVWLDEELKGGQGWWDHILAEIRSCDIFIFALSPKALQSTACIREFNYASGLRKPVLPVLLTDNVSHNLMPRTLSEVQSVDYRHADKAAALAIAGAITNLSDAPPLPDPLPGQPEVPISYLDELKTQVETQSDLSFKDQTALVLLLKERLAEDDVAGDARFLLLQLRERDDLFAKVAQEIDTLLVSTKEPSAETEIPKAVPHDKRVTTEDSSIPLSTALQTSPQRKSTFGATNQTVIYEGHKIEIVNDSTGRVLSGTERVFYDGQEVSREESAFGKNHFFRVSEDGVEVQYEVKLRSSWHGYTWWCEIKRDGAIIFTNR